ncbi:MAG: hypothetical protein ACLTKH_10430 [Eubacterium sp.]
MPFSIRVPIAALLTASVRAAGSFDREVSERVQYLIGHHHTYNNIDGIDYQILVEADFLVNICDDNLTKEAALKAYNNIFKTECGKKICREMFGLE